MSPNNEIRGIKVIIFSTGCNMYSEWFILLGCRLYGLLKRFRFYFRTMGQEYRVRASPCGTKHDGGQKPHQVLFQLFAA